MKDNTLVSMTKFVVWINTVDFRRLYKDQAHQQGYKMHLCLQYAEFLQQTLELWQFVPCKMIKGAWVAIEEPNINNYQGKDTRNIDYQQDTLRYQQAKDCVLFEGVNIKTMKELFSIKENFELTYTVEDLMELCSFDDAPPTLTKTALKQIGL